VRFILLQAILRELRFITLTAFPVFGNQIARLSKLPAHLASSTVSKDDENREKSQFKMDQDFG
ncbi:hypothetical protein, partial [uncultured Parabacteroides sp.]|uniref:hypothetical protein n=1 Tax=uncultured Parabacteroides sp. TaxID=512312 RepID=UPI002591EA4E